MRRTGVSKYAKDDPKAELTDGTLSPLITIPLQKQIRLSHSADRPIDRSWKDAKNSTLVAMWQTLSVRWHVCCARWRANRHFMFSVPIFSPRSVGKSDALIRCHPLDIHWHSIKHGQNAAGYVE